MASNWQRYGEARLYFAGGSIGLLVLFWSIFFARDQAANSAAESQSAADQATSSSVAPNQASAPAPQTRTRGS